MILNGGWTSLIDRVTFDANKICNSSDHTVIDTHTIIKVLFTKVFSTQIETIVYQYIRNLQLNEPIVYDYNQFRYD